MRIQFALYLFVISLMSCPSPGIYGQGQGVVIVHRYLFEPDITIGVSFKILYIDNRSIQQIPQLNIIEDSSGKKTYTKILYYSYLNPDKNVCYNYRNLSDTARILKYYTDIDSVDIDGGWNFYSNKNLQYDSSTNLNDTVINGINYNRIRLDKKINGNSIYFHVYLRCDKKGTLIKFFKPLSDQIGCPVVRIDTYQRNRLTTSGEIQFLSDKLSQEELKVFDAWEKNAEGIQPINDRRNR